MTPNLLSHAVDGEGPPVLLLNGGLMSYAAWEPFVAVVAQSCRVVRCDFRGQLLSPGEAPSAFAGHADDVLRLMDALEIDSAHIAGASFGALAGITLAARAPDRARSLVAITATDRMTADMDAGSARMRDACRAALGGGDGGQVLDLVNPATWSPEFLTAQAPMLAARRQAVAGLPRAWFAGLEGLLASLDGLDLGPLLPAITCRTLVISGDRDVTFPVDHSRELAARIPRARLVVVPGGYHGLVVEHAALVIPLLLDFVRETESARARPSRAEARP
jgi:pimeloyl-ACP methyl ester carboxylesterase